MPAGTAALPAHPRHILICEDDRDIATLLTLMLAQNGCQADIAYSVAQARELLARSQYDAMTLDLGLPDQDGVTFIRELRTQERTRQLPIVVVSAQAAQGQALLNGEALLVVDWLDKPIDQHRLVAAIQRAVQPNADTQPHVLHIEDDADLRQVIAAVLQDVATVVPAASLREATTCLQTDRFDLVILDLHLPDGSGLDLLPLLRQQRPALPVVIFSARELDSASAYDVAAVLVKSRASNRAFRETILALIRHDDQLIEHQELKRKEAGIVQ